MDLPGRLHHAVHEHPLGADAAVAAIAYAVTLLTTVGGPRSQTGGQVFTRLLVAGLTCGVLVLRRRWPFAVLAATTAGATVFLMLSPARGWALAAPLVALYSAAETTGRRRALTIGWLAVLVLVLTHAVARPVPWFGSENVTLIALGGLAVAAGDAARSRRAYVAEVEERARRAEREREQEAGRRVTEERLRIARDLHDSMGHHLALINVQAGAAAAVLDRRPAQAREAVEHIGQASRAALDELGNTVALLRAPGDPEAPTGPAGLAGLDELLGSFERSGLRIDHVTEGTPRPLPPPLDAAAYRVIEESLTNVRRHAGDADTRVLVGYGPTTLHIVVEDDGRGEAGGDGAVGETAEAGHGLAVVGGESSAAGHGLAGMRERVTAVGGHLNAGPRHGGAGFRVSALLPYPDGGRPG